MSAVLRPPAHALPLLTIAAGVAVAEGIQAATGLRADVKWPNDVYAHGRKLAGILAEASSSNAAGASARRRRLRHQRDAGCVSAGGRRSRDDLEAELGRAVDRGLLLAEYLCALAARYQDLHDGRGDAVVRAWRARAASMLGRRVEWDARRRHARGRRARHRRYRRAGRADRGRARARHGGRSEVGVNDDPETYCREVEAYLCRKNDGHLIRIVGPAFEQVCGWAARGVPLNVVNRGIDRYFERYYAKGPRRRPVRIEFCEADVLDVFDEWRRAVGVARASAGQPVG